MTLAHISSQSIIWSFDKSNKAAAQINWTCSKDNSETQGWGPMKENYEKITWTNAQYICMKNLNIGLGHITFSAMNT